MHVYITLLLLVVFSACSTQAPKSKPLPVKPKPQVQKPKLPTWITLTPKSSHSIYATGASSNSVKSSQSAKERATNAAHAQLMTTLVAMFAPSHRPQKAASLLQEEVFKLMQNKTAPAYLSAIKISQTYVGRKRSYALVKASRKEMGTLLLQQIKAREAELKPYLHKTLTGTTYLQQLMELLPAQQILVKRQDLIKQWQKIRKKSYRQGKKRDIVKLQKRLDGLFKRLQIRLVLQQQQELSIAQELLSELAQQGITPKLPQADLELSLNVQTTAVQRAGSYYMFISAKARFDDDAHRTFTTFEQQVKGVSGTQQVAAQKAVKAFSKDLIAQFARALMQHQTNFNQAHQPL